MDPAPAVASPYSTVPPRLVPLPRRRQVLSDDVYERVKALIMDHVIASGERINMDALSRKLQVSPTPIREALARLESDGLIRKEPLRGYSATPVLTRAELDDLYEFRLHVEPWAAARAAERAGSARTALRRELDTCSIVPQGGDYEAFKAIAAHDTRFHDLIMTMADNTVMHAAYAHTHCHLHVFRLYYSSGLATAALREHRLIVKAIEDRAPERAAAAMTAHLESSHERLAAVFD